MTVAGYRRVWPQSAISVLSLLCQVSKVETTAKERAADSGEKKHAVQPQGKSKRKHVVACVRMLNLPANVHMRVYVYVCICAETRALLCNLPLN